MSAEIDPEQYAIWEESEKRGLLSKEKLASWNNYKRLHGLNGWSDVLSQAISNAPSSGVRVISDTVDALTSPVETLKTIGGLAKGYATKALPDFIQWEGREAAEQPATLMNQYFADRYGTERGLKKAIGQDPVGVLADVSTLFTGSGGALRGLGKATGMTSKLAPVGKVASKAGAILEGAGTITDPLGVTLKLGSLGAEKAWGMTPAQKLYEVALAPNTGFSNNGKPKYSDKQVLGMVNAGLANRIPVTDKGLEKANGIISDLNSEIDGAIAGVDNAGLSISPNSVANGALYSDRYSRVADTVAPSAGTRMFLNTVMDFNKNYGREPLSLSKAQQLKKNTYQELAPTYANNAKPMHSGTIEGKKALAGELRQAIADKVDEGIERGLIPPLENGRSIHDINAKEGALIDLRDNIQRSFLNNSKKAPVDWMLAGMGSILSQDPVTGLALGAAKQFLTSPGVRSRGAFFLDNAYTKRTGNPFRLPLASAYLPYHANIFDAMKAYEAQQKNKDKEKK